MFCFCVFFSFVSPGCNLDSGMLYNLLATIFCRCLFADIPFCCKQFANLLQSGIFIGDGKFWNESSDLRMEKSNISSCIHPLVALSHARFACINWWWECSSKYEAKIIIISTIVISATAHSKQRDFSNTTTNIGTRFASSFIITSISSWIYDGFSIATATTITPVTDSRANRNSCHCSKCEMRLRWVLIYLWWGFL